LTTNEGVVVKGKVFGMQIAVGFPHGIQPLHGQSTSVWLAGMITLLVMAMLGVVVWAAVSRRKHTGGGGWWRGYPDDQPSPWRPIPGLGPSRRPHRVGMRSPVCPVVRTERSRPATAPSRITALMRSVASSRS